MQRTTITLALLGLLAVLQAPGADGVRIAILAGEGERAPKVGVVDRLMAELSKRPEVVILEREAIGKILAEQKLSLSGLADRTQAVRTGLLLSADLLLAVERIGQEQDKARQYRVKVIEAQTGLTVGDRFFDGPAVEQKPEPMAAVMDRCLEWLRTPAGRRRYVAVVGYSAEQRQTSLTDLPVALTALVESRIAQATNVLVVDREYLRRLQDEQELTGVERQLALSSYLIEGLIRPSATNAAAIEVQTRIQSLQGTAEEPVLQALGSVSNVLVLAHDAAGAILRRIGADPLSSAPLPPAREAARLAGHAQMLQRYGETARALPPLESAFVLDPKPGTAILLAGTIKLVVAERAGVPYVIDNGGLAYKSKDLETLTALPETEKQALFSSLVRVMRLCQVNLDQCIADPSGKAVPGLPGVHYPAHILRMLWERLRSDDPETSLLYRELMQQKEACHRREVEYVRKLWPRFRYGSNRIRGSTGYYLLYIPDEAYDIGCRAVDTAEYAMLMKQLMDPWLEMPGYTSPYVLGRLLSSIEILGKHVRSEADMQEMLAWCDWVSRQPSLLFEFAALYYKTLVFRAAYWARVNKSIDLPLWAAVFREMLDLYPAILARYGYVNGINTLMEQALYPSGRVTLPVLLDLIDKEAVQILGRKFFDAVLALPDPYSFAQFFNANGEKDSHIASSLLRRLSEDDQRRVIEAALARLPPPHLARYRDEKVQVVVDAAREALESRLAELSTGRPTSPPEISPYWKAYEIVPVVLGTPPQRGEQLRLCKRVGDRLALVWAKEQDITSPRYAELAKEQRVASLTLRVEVCSLDGKPIGSFPLFVQSEGTKRNEAVEPSDVTLEDERVFVAAGAAGLLVFSPTDVRVHRVAEGLPRVPLATVEAIGGKVVMGFDADYLGAFDPSLGIFEEIAYSRSLLKRNPLDGCQQRFSVYAMAADPERECVWLATRQPHGVWRLSMQDNRIDSVGGNQLQTLNMDDGMLLGAWHSGLTSYNPATKQWTNIRLYPKYDSLLHPCHVPLGDDVISAGLAVGGTMTSGNFSIKKDARNGLYLHKSVVQETFHHPMGSGGNQAQIGFLIKISDRTALAGTYYGPFWRLTRPEGATPEEEAIVRRRQEHNAFVAAQTNHVPVRSIAASSTAGADYAVANLCDGLDDTCWAAATNETLGAWFEIELERPARLSSLRLVNGWIAKGRWPRLYLYNHRVRRFAVTTDTRERILLDVEDHNDPQFMRTTFSKPVRRLRFTVAEIHESEVIDFEDPPWLNLSEIKFYESREAPQ